MTYPTSVVHLLEGVPFSNNYQNLRTFTDVSAQTEYFLSKRFFTYNYSNYVRTHQTIRLEGKYDEMHRVNYMMFQNHEYTNKWFYAFITAKRYINPSVIEIDFEIDVWQSWQFSIQFKQSFVEREHVPDSTTGIPNINMIDEGIDYGTDMNTVYMKNVTINYGIKWLVIASKQTLSQGDRVNDSAIIGTPQALTYYTIPFRDDGAAVTVNIGNGSVTIATVKTLLDTLYLSEDAPNNIVSAYVTEHNGLAYTANNASSVTIHTATGQTVQVAYAGVGETVPMLHVKELQTFFDLEIEVNTNKYEGFPYYDCDKLYMYPYSQTILTDFKGNTFNIKNECISGLPLTLKIRGSLGISNKTSVEVIGYNNTVQNEWANFEAGFINSDAQDVFILNDQLAAYLQGNKNSLNVQRSQMMFNATIDAARAAGAGAAAMRNGEASGVADSAQSIGNNYYAIQGLNAKLQDISNVPPNIGYQGGNTAYTFGNGVNGYFIIKKSVKPEYRTRLEGYFKMFGLKVNQVKVPNLKSRSMWNYVKTMGCRITGSPPYDDLIKLMTIFDNGVTLWHTDNIGDYSGDNN